MRCHQLSVLSVLAAAPLANFATPLAQPWDDLRVKHTWNAVPHNWETLGHPPAGTTIDLHLALKPHHENALVDALYDVSAPRSPKYVLSNTPQRTITVYSCVPLLRCRYGAHLSKEQVAQLVAPHPDTLALINSWLEHHGVPSSSISTTQGGSGLTLTSVPVSQANELLGAEYQLYRRTGMNDSTILRTIGYALPSVLHAHVQTVVPTTYFTSTRTLLQTPRKRSAGATVDMALRGLPTDKVTPLDLRDLYKTSDYVPAATDRNVLGITGYLGAYPSRADLTTFMTKCRTDAVDASFTVERANGGEYDSNHPDGEANLSMQYTQAIAYPTRHIFYSTGGKVSIHDNNNEPARGDMWLEWLNYVLDQPNVPQTISTSYGDYENNLPLGYARTSCNLYAQLGTRGASVIFSSGNDGVGNGDCKTNDGRVRFIPAFPVSCMCSVLFLCGSSTPSQEQVAHHISTASQVPMSLAWAARWASTPRSWRTSLGAASRTILRALPTRTMPCPPS